jgi:HPt (histidine-containing phosphotransfer) domain-containing protein
MTNHIDLTELNKVADGDQEFMKETIALLLQEIPENIQHIDNYVTNNDLIALKKLVHKMKSSFMLIGMKELWPVIGTIEKSDSSEVIMGQVPEFVRICKESVEELKSI